MFYAIDRFLMNDVVGYATGFLGRWFGLRRKILSHALLSIYFAMSALYDVIHLKYGYFAFDLFLTAVMLSVLTNLPDDDSDLLNPLEEMLRSPRYFALFLFAMNRTIALFAPASNQSLIGLLMQLLYLTLLYVMSGQQLPPKSPPKSELKLQSAIR